MWCQWPYHPLRRTPQSSPCFHQYVPNPSQFAMLFVVCRWDTPQLITHRLPLHKLFLSHLNKAAERPDYAICIALHAWLILLSWPESPHLSPSLTQGPLSPLPASSLPFLSITLCVLTVVLCESSLRTLLFSRIIQICGILTLGQLKEVFLKKYPLKSTLWGCAPKA